MNNNIELQLPQLELITEDIINAMFKKQNVDTLKKIRVNINEMLNWGISPVSFLQKLSILISPKLNEQCKHQAIKTIAFFEHR
jgi:hypothetical protein